MKKYNLFLLVSILSLILLIFNVKAVNASDSGCTGAGPYNTLTGQLCGTATVSVACPAGDLFSPLTGQPCSKTTTTVSNNTTGDLNQGLKFGSKGDSVKTLQQTLKNAGLLSGSVDGVYGKLTSAAVQKWNQIYACPLTNSATTAGGINSNSNCVPLTPIKLPTGTGTITVVSPNGGETWVKSTTQAITWQDNSVTSSHYDIQLTPYYAPCTSKICPMIASYPFHSPYTIVKNVSGTSYSWNVGNVLGDVNSLVPDGSYTIQVCRTGTDVCDSTDGSFSITTSGSTTTNTLSVISPNGGETWLKGITQAITWQDSTILPPCAYGSTNCPPLAYYDIQLIPYHAPCTTNMCPMIAYPLIEYNVANNVSGTSYSWNVGNVLNNGGVYPLNTGQAVPNPTITVAPNGSYTIQVCKTGTNVCDSSNAPFSIVSEQANGTIIITN